MMTLPKVNPFNFSAAAVACSQDKYIDRRPLQSALCMDCFAVPSIEASSLFSQASTALKAHLQKPFVAQGRIPGPFRCFPPAYINFIHALTMPHHNKVLPLGS